MTHSSACWGRRPSTTLSKFNSSGMERMETMESTAVASTLHAPSTWSTPSAWAKACKSSWVSPMVDMT